jgi:tryptophan-rich sensory protein
MPSSPTTRAVALAGSLGSVSGTAATGAFVSVRHIRWYRSLDKPRWFPPELFLGPAWALVYAGQAVSAWLFWRAGDDRDELDVPALSSYAASLGLSLAWALSFFGFRRLAVALVVSCALWLAVVTTVREFAHRHRFAAAMLLPYLAWVTVATALNLTLWWRNR